jgi:hypothetical protein
MAIPSARMLVFRENDANIRLETHPISFDKFSEILKSSSIRRYPIILENGSSYHLCYGDNPAAPVANATASKVIPKLGLRLKIPYNTEEIYYGNYILLHVSDVTYPIEARVFSNFTNINEHLSLPEIVNTIKYQKTRLYATEGIKMVFRDSPRPTIQQRPSPFSELLLSLTLDDFVKIKKDVANKPSEFIAKQAAELHVIKNETCTISLENLNTYDKLYVGICGHVFSPMVKECTECPNCRVSTDWTEVCVEKN